MTVSELVRHLDYIQRQGVSPHAEIYLDEGNHEGHHCYEIWADRVVLVRTQPGVTTCNVVPL